MCHYCLNSTRIGNDKLLHNNCVILVSYMVDYSAKSQAEIRQKLSFTGVVNIEHHSELSPPRKECCASWWLAVGPGGSGVRAAKA